MSEDRELSAMGRVLEVMEPLEGEARKRVLVWLTQKLGIELSLPQHDRQPVAVQPQSLSKSFDLSTDTIANILEASSGADLIIAAAAQLHFVQAKQRFTRREITAEMRTAPGHFKEAFLNNLSTYLKSLTKADRLRLVAADTFALSNKERQSLQEKLVNAA
ncbi:hypothetical protein [Bradyrhizobium sp. CCBAU 51753]|uniref:hypothetical protein n=1 Tax=Bradyrhizobium sp. CCBAU 51753 TaxID=1325100 RepID=UPI00188CB64C|nr:hypothetical protein [Bradyrhizobium sp. CCBAU 51753]